MTHAQRLTLAVGASLILHGWGLFLLPAQHRVSHRMVEADPLLQIELTPDIPAPALPVAPAPEHPAPHHPAPHHRPVVGHKASPPPIPSPTPTVQAEPAPAVPAEVRARSLKMARSEFADPFAGQRLRRISPRSQDEVFGPYEEAYRQKVEAVGTVNYPPPVNGRRLYGTVRLTAILRQDGSLVQVDLMQSSGSPDLDDAACRIIRMAAPFQPFTPDMRVQADLVSITRSFNFVRAGEAIHSQ